tara:strand:- start:12347 stop:13873 length:1527 start_codon:yes stop_codon:yes gene_type:complete
MADDFDTYSFLQQQQSSGVRQHTQLQPLSKAKKLGRKRRKMPEHHYPHISGTRVRHSTATLTKCRPTKRRRKRRKKPKAKKSVVQPTVQVMAPPAESLSPRPIAQFRREFPPPMTTKRPLPKTPSASMSWTQKHCPTTMSGVLVDDYVKKKILNFMSGSHTKVLVLCGGSGVGKTCLGRVALRGYKLCELNCSSVTDTDIAAYLRKCGLLSTLETGQRGGILLDELDNCFDVLKKVTAFMKKHATNSRLGPICCTCNSIYSLEKKLQPLLQLPCVELVRVYPPKVWKVERLIGKILMKENLSISKMVLRNVCTICAGDVRKSILSVQWSLSTHSAVKVKNDKKLNDKKVNDKKVDKFPIQVHGDIFEATKHMLHNPSLSLAQSQALLEQDPFMMEAMIFDHVSSYAQNIPKLLDSLCDADVLSDPHTYSKTYGPKMALIAQTAQSCVKRWKNMETRLEFTKFPQHVKRMNEVEKKFRKQVSCKDITLRDTWQSMAFKKLISKLKVKNS